jgi:hypothetical protein
MVQHQRGNNISAAQVDQAAAHAPGRRGDDWLHDIKFDGYRMHARIDGGKVKPEAKRRVGDPMARLVKPPCIDASVFAFASPVACCHSVFSRAHSEPDVTISLIASSVRM